ncbi:MAG: methyltransferase domain-containing protein [Phenylobacterium sp.]|uniref:methyltransferase domain-containing protein n=1 Tax=Phenylobacterium sp. TaxID=1871053 RepID=UPI0027333917|nr:methyltransferase domain-containing protein [Phenylobacterium sp.]MDP3172871.1 methyltransferase domain-containing protein [Phenylobacterium sp.]
MRLQPEAALADDRYVFVREFLKRRPAPATGGVLFDIGAGEVSVMRADAESAGYAWRGFDLVPSSADVSQWNIDTPFTGSERADVVLLMDVIEHTFNPGFAIRNIADALKPGGRLVMTTPNPRWSRARTLHLFSGFPACFTQHDLDVNHHVFPLWPHVMEQLVAEAGLEVERYVVLDRDEIKPKPLSAASPGLWVEGLMRKAIEARDLSSRGMSYAVVARRVGAAA